MASYEAKLPAIHLVGDELESFEEAIMKNSTNPSFSVVIEDGGFKYEKSSFEDFINDIDTPDCATDYKIKMSCDEGRVRIAANRLTNATLRISGEKNWVQKKKQDIQGQIDKNKHIVRTYIRAPIYGVYLLQWVWIFVIDMTQSDGSATELTTEEALVAVVLFGLFITWPGILIMGIDYVYPRQLIRRDESVRYRPKLRKAVGVIIVLLSIIGGVGGLMSLLSI